jgi:thiol-disulfide isomerase/thioredoxin
MKPGRAWIVLAVLATGLVAAVAIRSATGPAAVERADLSFTLRDMNGQDVKLSDFAGKPLIVNLWATWCAPCRVEMPQLVELSERYKSRGVTIIGISIDDSPEEIRDFAKQFGVPYPLLVGDGRDDVLSAMGYYGPVPMTVFIRADGIVTHRMPGIATTRTWERHIEALF